MFVFIVSKYSRELTMLRFIRMPELRHITGLSSATIYRYIAKKQFPASIPLGTRIVAWSSEDIEKWIAEKIEQAKKPKQFHKIVK
jgi:prophage regulatory protein